MSDLTATYFPVPDLDDEPEVYPCGYRPLTADETMELVRTESAWKAGDLKELVHRATVQRNAKMDRALALHCLTQLAAAPYSFNGKILDPVSERMIRNALRALAYLDD
jgi:hypothetical protein